MSTDIERWIQQTDRERQSGKPPLGFAAGRAPNPDRAARVLRAQQLTGLTGDIVDRQLEQIEDEERRRHAEFQAGRDPVPPVLDDWLRQDPAHVAVAGGDVGRLSYLERQIRHIANQYQQGNATVRLTNIGTAAMAGRATDEQRAEQRAIEAELGQQIDYGIGQRQSVFHRFGPRGDAIARGLAAAGEQVPLLKWLGGAPGLAEQVPGAMAQQAPILAQTFKGKGIGAAAGAVAGVAWGGGTPASIPTAIAGAGLGWRLGGVVPAAQMEASTAFLDYEKLTDEQGRPLDRRLILGAAIVTGGVNGILEAVSLDKLTKSIPGLRTLGRKGMRELLAKQSTRQALEHALIEIGQSAMTEGVTEFTQSYVTNLSGRIAQLAQTGKSMSVGELLESTVGDPAFFEQAKKEGLAGALAGGGFATLGGAASVALKRRQIQRAEQVSDVFTALGGAKDSELLQRMPEAHRELVSRMTKNGPLENTYIEPERFTEYFQSVNLDPGEVAAELLGSREAYDNAMRTGELLVIPTATYASTLAGTEHHAGLLEDLSFSPTELSMRDARAEAKTLDEEVAKAMEAAAPRAAEAVDQAAEPGPVGEAAARESAEQVTEDITAQLRKAGFNASTARTYASALYGNVLRTLAHREGKGATARELLARFNLRISRPGQPGAPALPPVNVDALRRAHVASREAALMRLGKLVDVDGQVRFDAPRTPQGARRPVERVSMRGLLAELLDLEEKRADAELRSVYELREDPNFHTDGIPQVVATREPGQASRQAKALQNLEDFKRITEQVHNELASRGLKGPALLEAIEELRAELDERAALEGNFDALGRGEQITDDAGNVLFQPAAPVDSPAFRRWFGDSKVVDANGDPLVVFHGTTRHFDTFDRGKSDPGSDLGAAFYFTNDEDDVEINYAGLGPDLTNKVEMRAESYEYHIEQQLEGIAGDVATEAELEQLRALSPEGGYQNPRSLAVRALAKEKAKQELMEHPGATMPVYLSLQNPAIIGGRDETVLTYEEPYNEELEEYGEPTGTLLGFVEALRSVAISFDSADPEEAISLLFQEAAERDGEVTLAVAHQFLRNANGTMFASDAQGNLAPNELFRRALEAAGFDGVIDHTVNEKFGDARSSGQAMEGMGGATTHYVAFRPGQVKSAIANVGTFDPANPSILFQAAPAIETPAFQAWFQDSKMVTAVGNPAILYHQTTRAAEAAIEREGFDINRPWARRTDELVPDGIFLKPADTDIGLGSRDPAEIAQIPLYASIQNPLVLRDRQAIRDYFATDPTYLDLAMEVQIIDQEIVDAYDQASAEFDRLPLAEKAAQGRDYTDRMDALFKSGNVRMAEAATKARARLTEVLVARGYDGMVIQEDQGSFGRVVTTIIALQPTQVKSATKNVGTFRADAPSILLQSADDYTLMTMDPAAWRRQMKQAEIARLDPSERVVAAAIRHRDGTVTFGPTHYHALGERAYDELPAAQLAELEEGFLTDQGRFVGREAADVILSDVPSMTPAELEAFLESDATLHTGDLGERELPGYGGSRSGVILPGTGRIAPLGRGRVLEQRAYHGTRFKFDAFSLAHMGKGEGAQAYGWGLYFAGDKAVAEYYRRTLSNEEWEFHALTEEQNKAIVSWMRRGIMLEPASSRAQLTREFIADIDAGIAEGLEELAGAERGEDVLQPWLIAEGIERQRKRRHALAELLEGDDYTHGKTGRVYTVELPDSDGYVLYDKPLSEQSEQVRRAFEALGIRVGTIKYPTDKEAERLFAGPYAQRGAREDVGIRQTLSTGHHLLLNGRPSAFRAWFAQHGKLLSPTRHDDMTGEQAYETLSWRLKNDEVARRYNLAAREDRGSVDVGTIDRQELASKALRAHGITGIKYLDGQSRLEGEGQHNYVIFDDTDINIVEYEQTVYHGTPYSTFDKFSLAAVGTGEGAQVYGWGLYFAGKKAVAQWYRDKLSKKGTTPRSEQIDVSRAGTHLGTLRQVLDLEFEAIADRERKASVSGLYRPPSLVLVRALSSVTGAIDDAAVNPALAKRSIVEGAIENIQDRTSLDTHGLEMQLRELDRRQQAGTLRPPVGGEPRYNDQRQALEDRIAKLETIGRLAEELIRTLEGLELTPAALDPGRVFTVELPDDARWLDWDLEIAQQLTPELEAALGDLVKRDVVTIAGYPSMQAAFAAIGYDTTRGVGTLPTGILTWSRALEAELQSNGGDLEQAIERLLAYTSYQADAQYMRARDNLVERIRAARWSTRVTSEVDPYLTGETLYHELTYKHGTAQRASEWLRAQGIPGIKYLDGMSRSSGVGDHNYVVFDDALIEVREYEQAIDADPLDPDTTLELERQLADQPVAMLARLAPLLEDHPAGMARTGREIYDELLLLAQGGFLTELAGVQPPVLTPAVRIGEAIHKGRTHDEAADKARAVGVNVEQMVPGYTTAAGTFVERQAAQVRLAILEDPHALVARVLSRQGIEAVARGGQRINMREYEQRTGRQAHRELLVQHNVTAANLLHAEQVGGLAVPSLAITKDQYAITGYGEITLLGDKALADPRRAGNRVFAADVYSPRYPEVSYVVSPKQLTHIAAVRFDQYNAIAGEQSLRYQLDEINSRGTRPIEQHGSVVAAFLAEHGIPLPAELGQPVPTQQGLNAPTRPMSTGERFSFLMREVRNHGRLAEFDAYARRVLEQLEPKQRIRAGYDANGNPRFKAHTLANVVRALKAQPIRGGEGFNYGLPNLRALVTPELRSLTEIREAAPRIVSDAEFDAVRDRMDEELIRWYDRLLPYNPDPQSFRHSEAVSGIFEDAVTQGFPRAVAEWGFRPVPPELMAEMAGFLEELREMPTEYFENKVQRAVDVAEFRVAVIPEGSPRELVELLQRKGVAIETYPMGSIDSRRKAIAAAAAKHDTLFQRPSDPRGRIRIGNQSIEIELLEKANLSTFIHETGHFYLEVLGSLAGSQDAAPQLTADYATILAYLGNDGTEPLTRDQHETFARSFEAYLFEGKAPTPELRTAFARFRTWLLQVYRSLKGLRVELTPEVRQVFDRMFATDQELEAARAEQSMDALFPDPRAVGMTPAEAQRYGGAVMDARIAASEHLTAKALDELQRARKQWWQEERERVRDAVQAEVYAEPLTRALAILQRGTEPDGSPLPEGTPALKLDRKALTAAFGKEVVKSLPTRPSMFAKENGMTADEAAQAFGFPSGQALIQQLATSERTEKRIDRLTDERMERDHGNMLEDGTLADQAMAAVHNVDRGRVLRLELEHLVSQELAATKGMIRKLGRRIRSSAATRQQAEDRIARMHVRDISPGVFKQAEAKAARLAADKFSKGDIEGAFEEKLRELQNYELYRAATAALEQAEAIAEYMRSFDRGAVRQRIGKAGGSYLEQIDAIRDRYSFTRASTKALDKRQSLLAFVAEAKELGTPIDVPESLLNEAQRQHWRETPIEELAGVRDAVEQIAHLARTKNRLLANEATRNLEDARAELHAEAASHFDLANEPVDLTRPFADRLHRQLEGAVAAHTRMEFLFRQLDGFQADGPFWTHFFKPFARAEDHENTMRRRDAEVMRELLAPYSKKERAAWFTERFDIPGTTTARVEGTFTKQNVLAIALNWGNAYNRQALLEGSGWTEQQVERILSTLTPKDAQFIQAIWNHIDTYWPAAEQLEKDITGVAPAKVEAVPTTIAGVQLRGGYYPIAFDREQSSRQTGLDLAAAVSDMARSYGARAMTRHGHLVERTSTGGKPLRLDLSVISEHLSQVTHDLSHRRAVIDVAKLIRDPEIQATIEQAAGMAMYQQLGPWLAGIAGDVPRENVAKLEQIASRARGGVSAVGLGLNLASSIVQTLGFSNAVNELGPVYAAKGLQQAFGVPWRLNAQWEFITQRSPAMRDRLGNFDREVRDLARAPGQIGVLGVDPSTLYLLIGYMDMGVSIPSWLGAYAKAMDGKKDGIAAGNEQAAIDYADQVVRTTQAAGGAKDLAQVQRGTEFWKLYTAFYSSMSVLFNQFRQIPARYRQDKNVGRVIASLTLVWFLPAVLEDILRGRGPDDDDDTLKWALRKIALYPLGTVVLLRDFANALERSYETGRVSLGQNALGTLIESAARTIAAMTKEVRPELGGEGREATRADWREAFNTVGYFAQLPTRQTWKTGEFFYDWWTGKTQPTSPLDVVSGVVHGTPKGDR